MYILLLLQFRVGLCCCRKKKSFHAQSSNPCISSFSVAPPHFVSLATDHLNTIVAAVVIRIRLNLRSFYPWPLSSNIHIQFNVLQTHWENLTRDLNSSPLLIDLSILIADDALILPLENCSLGPRGFSSVSFKPGNNERRTRRNKWAVTLGFDGLTVTFHLLLDRFGVQSWRRYFIIFSCVCSHGCSTMGSCFIYSS